MKNGHTLQELLRQDSRSQALFDSLSRDVQAALQEQRQNIRTYEELADAAKGFEKRSHK